MPVVVVGAGIIGLAIAHRLQHSGVSVVVIDRQAPGRGCSFGNVGRIASECIEPLASPHTLRNSAHYLLDADSPLSIHPRYAVRMVPWLLRFALKSRQRDYESGAGALRLLQAQSMSSFEQLVDEAGIRALLKTRGHLLVCEQKASKPALVARQAWFKQHDVICRWMNSNELRQLAPELPKSLFGGIYFPDTAHVSDPYRVCRGLAASIEKKGGKIVRGDVNEVRATPDGGFELRHGEDCTRCSKLVIAAGAWSARLARQLGHKVPLETERGYHLTAKGWTSHLRIPVESYERHTVMTPMSEGLRISGFVEFGGLELPANPRRFAALRQHLRHMMPGAELSDCSEWMGFRPSLPDHLPVIGRCPLHRNAILAFGPHHLGHTLSVITASIVYAPIDEREPLLNIEPFSAGRFR
jgi:D-amino-acid dehydrogenase